MEEIKRLEDIFKLILSVDSIEPDFSSGSDITIPIYEISAEEFLDFAENAIMAETKEGIVNAISNLKRAIDCEMDLFFESINLKSIFDKNNLKFEKKSKFLSDIGMFPIQSINKLNLIRNKMEHEYRAPLIADLYTYYELVWDVVKIIDLHLELLYTNGEINMVLKKGSDEYYFMIRHDIENCGFRIKIKNWTKGADKIEKQLEICLTNKESAYDFINAFNFYLLSIQYFDYGNISLYKNKVKKLMKSQGKI